MPVTLKQVVDHVVAMEGPDADRTRISAIVRETLHAVGLEVSARNDEVYNPAAPPARYVDERSTYVKRGLRRR